MRQWMVNPSLLCNKHLLGEHFEHHMFVGTLNKNISVQGYIDKSLLEVHRLKERHEELVEEMKRRGMNHNSILPDFKVFTLGNVDIEENLKELKNRCLECKRRIEKNEAMLHINN